MPTLRLSTELSPGRSRGAPGDPGLGREVSAGYLHSFEAELTHVSGEDSGMSGSTIVIGDAVFAPGASLDSEFRLTAVSVASTSGFRSETGLEVSAIYGLEYTSPDLTVKSTGQKGEFDQSELGPLLGVRLRWLATEDLRIYGSSRVSFLVYQLSQSEVGVEYRVVPRVSLFTGYRRTEYRYDDGSDSEIVMKWKGLVAGIQLEF